MPHDLDIPMSTLAFKSVENEQMFEYQNLFTLPIIINNYYNYIITIIILCRPLRKYDDSALIRSKIEPTESIVIRDVPLTSLSNISELSNMDDILTSALKEGGGKLKTCNVVLHGPPGVGKSSLKRLILGYPPLQREQQNATGIIENAVRAVSTTRLAGGRQTLAEVNNVELIKMLAKQVKFLHLSSDIPQDDSTHQHIPVSV